MKPESGQEILHQTIDNWWILRERLNKLIHREPINPRIEMEFLEAKGQIARKLQFLVRKAGNPGDMREIMIRYMRRISSLEQIQQLAIQDLSSLEKECHHIYIQLNKWYGEISSI